MIKYNLFLVADGLFTGAVIASSRIASLHIPDEVDFIAGVEDWMSQKVDIDRYNALPEDQRRRGLLPESLIIGHQPLAPSADHEWDDVSRRWVLSDSAQIRAAARANAITEIARLEASQPRALRELNLAKERGDDQAYVAAFDRLEAIDNRIAELRPNLKR